MPRADIAGASICSPELAVARAYVPAHVPPRLRPLVHGHVRPYATAANPSRELSTKRRARFIWGRGAGVGVEGGGAGGGSEVVRLCVACYGRRVHTTARPARRKTRRRHPAVGRCWVCRASSEEVPAVRCQRHTVNAVSFTRPKIKVR